MASRRGSALSALVLLVLGSSSPLFAQISGVVRDESLSTVSGLGVQLEFANGGVAGSTATNGSGAYDFTGLADGIYVVKTLSDPGRDLVSEFWQNVNEFDRDLATRITVSGGVGRSDVDFVVGVGGTLSGTITGLLPGQFANVEAFDAVTNRFRGNTSSDGTSPYTIANLPPGQYKIRVYPGGTTKALQWYDGKTRFLQANPVTLALNADVTGKDFSLTSGTSIAGQITLDPPNAAALANTWLEALDASTFEHVISVQSDSGGNYTLANLPPGSYIVQAHPGNGYIREVWASGQVDVSSFNQATAILSPESGINFTLELGRTIAGHVTMGARDIADANVNANLSGPCCAGNGTRTDSSGIYTITGLRPGLYSVNVQATSPDDPFVEERWNDKTFLNDGQDLVDVTAMDATGIDFDVAAGAVISGVVYAANDTDAVRDPDELTISGNGTVRAFDAATSRCCSHAQIGGDGRYALALPAGRSYLVEASTYQGTRIREFWQNAYYQQGATPVMPPQANVDFGLEDGAVYGPLQGRVVGTDGMTGLPGVEVRVQLFTSGQFEITRITTSADGIFSFLSLAPGEYKLLFDTQNANVANDQDYVSEYWTRCQTTTCPPGVIDPNDVKVVHPTAPGVGTSLGDFELSLGGSISGRMCLGGEGAPCPSPSALPASFSVRAQSSVSAGPNQPFIPSASVDQATGLYHMRGLPAPNSYRVQAETFGTEFVPVYYRTAADSTFNSNSSGAVSVSVGGESTGIDLHLFEGGSISGQVTCNSGASLVSGFPISVDLVNQPNVFFFANAQTDSNGDYVVRALPSGQFRVRADSRGGGFGACGTLANETYPTLVTVVEAQDTPDIDFDLAPGGSIRGTITQIVGGGPTAVVNIRVSAFDYDTGQFVSDARTNAQGDYEIQALAQGRDYRVVVETQDGNQDPQFFNFIREFYDDAILFSDASRVSVPTATPVENIDFLLELGGAISGTVRDEVGPPLSGVSVCANELVFQEFGNCDSTDQNGFYIIRGLPAADYRVNANPAPQNFVAEYFDNTLQFGLATPVTVVASTTGIPVPVTPNVDFDLAAGFGISGRVTAAAGGAPVPSLSMRVQGVRVTTDDDGMYQFVGLPPGRSRVTAETAGTAFARQEIEVEIVSLSLTGIDFSLGPGAHVRGRVYEDVSPANDEFDPGEEREGVFVQAFDFVSGVFGASATSDAAGLYDLSGLPAGTYRVRTETSDSHDFVQVFYDNKLRFDQANPLVIDPPVGGVAQDRNAIDFRVVKGRKIRGHVFFDANENGLQDLPAEPDLGNIQINANSTDGFFNYGSRTDGNGDYDLTALGSFGGSPVLYRLSVRAQGTPYASEFWVDGDAAGTFKRSLASSLDVSSGDRNGVDFSLVLGGSIRGTVIDETTSSPIPNVNVNANPLDGDGFGFGATTDASGQYLIDGLAPFIAGVHAGTYTLQARDNAGIYVTEYHNNVLFSSDATPVTLNQRSSPGDLTATVVDFALVVGGAITGVVYADVNEDGDRDPEDTPVASVNVNVNEFAASNRFLNSSSTLSDGTFRVGGLPAGMGFRIQVFPPSSTFYVVVYYDGASGGDKGTTSFASAVSVSVTAGGTTPNVNFALTNGGKISGLVQDGNGNAISNLNVNANGLTPNLSGAGARTDSTVTVNYTIAGLAPGDYRVTTGGGSSIYPFEAFNNQPDNNAATPVRVTANTITPSVDFILSPQPRILSALSQTTGVRGGPTLTGITFTADRLAGTSLCATTPVPPCTRFTLGVGLTVQNASLVIDGSGVGTFTFDLQIEAAAALGMRSLSVVNDFVLGGPLEDTAGIAANAFNVTGGTPVASAQILYATDNQTAKLRSYGIADSSPRPASDTSGTPGGVTLSSDGSFAYVAGNRILSVVDLRLGGEVGRMLALGSFGVDATAVTPARIYTVNREFGTNDRIETFDAQRWDPLGHVIAGTNPFSIKIDPSGQWAFVSNQGTATVPGTVSVIDLTTNTVVSTIAFPANVFPRNVAFTPNGSRTYVLAQAGTYLLNTALAAAGSPAFIDVDLDPTTGLSVGSQTGISAVPTSGGGNGLIDMAPSAPLFVYVLENNGRLRVIDASTDQPKIVRTVTSLGRGPAGVRVSPDGSKVFLAYGQSKDVYVLETAGILTSPSVSLSKFDQDTGPATAFGPSAMAVGDTPGDVPGSAPTIGIISVDGGGPARNGSPIALTITGSQFDATDNPQTAPIVSLAGTLVRGSVDLAQSDASTLKVTLPADTPIGSYKVVVTNPKVGGNESAVSASLLTVEPGASYSPSQVIYVSSDAKGGVTVIEPDGDRQVIATQPRSEGLALTPDGRLGLVQQLYRGPQTTATGLPDNNFDLAVIDLDPAHAEPPYRTVLGDVPYVLGAFESPAVTPNAGNPNGVFVYQPSRSLGDTVSVIDPVARVEIDVDGNPSTQSYPPTPGAVGSKLPGITRIELDSVASDFNLAPNDVAVTPDGNLLYTANIGFVGDAFTPAAPPSVSIVNTVTRQKIGQITFDGSAGDGGLGAGFFVAISPDGIFAYVVGQDTALDPYLFVYRVGVAEDSPAAFVERIALPTLPFPELPRGIVVSRDGGTVYIAARLRGELYAVDVRPGSPTHGLATGYPARLDGTFIPIPVGTNQMAIASKDDYLYVTNIFRDEIHVLDVDRSSPTYHQLVATLRGSVSPTDVAVQPPSLRIDGVVPTSGPEAGGTPVTITGLNFLSGATVEFGGTPATLVNVVNAFALTATTPAGAGTADVRVTNPGGETDVLRGRFNYVAVDNTPPVFTVPPYVASQTLELDNTVTAVIRWNTDEPSTSRVDYGTASALGAFQEESALVTSHVVTLTGLDDDVTHHFRATSADSSTNAASSPLAPNTSTFHTPAVPDTTAPLITSGPTVSTTQTTAVVQWQTNEQSTSNVQFDTTEDTVVNAPPGVSGPDGLTHSVTLAGLSTDTLYEYKVTSRDASNNPVTRIDTFRTDPNPDTAAPVFVSGPTVSYLSNNLVIVSWVTDEPSTSFVNYGANPPGCNVNEQGVIDVSQVTSHVVFLTNLLPGTAYGFEAGSTDGAGNTFVTASPCTGGAPLALGTVRLTEDVRMGVTTLRAGTLLTTTAAAIGFTTPATADTTAPQATLAVTVLSSDRALVSATTDEAASILASFGTSSLTDSAFDPSFTLTPSLVLAGLAASSNYQLSVTFTDPKGNDITLATTFSTPDAPDVAPPLISGLTVRTITETSAVISWTTVDEPATSTVRFGTGASLDGQVGILGLRTVHEITLTGLLSATFYNFAAESRDASKNPASETGNFTTGARAPSITSVAPPGAAQGQTLDVLINGSDFAAGVTVDFGSGVTASAPAVSAAGTQILVNVSVAANAPAGPRTISVRNPGGPPAVAAWDVRGLQVSIDDAVVTEGTGGATTASIAVTLSAVPGQNVSIGYSTNTGTAGASDFTSVMDGTLTFPAQGSATQFITVTINPDTVDENDETFTVSLTSSPSEVTIIDGTAQATILDDDGPPTVSIDDVTVAETNAPGTATFTASLSHPSAFAIDVSFGTGTGGSATPSVDFVSRSGVNVHFEPNATTQTVTVTIIGDTLDEPDETFFVNLTGASIGDGEGVGTITDDDPEPSVGINDVSVTEGSGGTRTAVFTLTLSAKSGQDVTVDFATEDDSALAPDDYQSVPAGQVVVPAGSQTGSISVTVVSDTLLETNETFFVNLGTVTNATLAAGRGVATIVDDDQGFSIGDAVVSEGNNDDDDDDSEAVFEVTLAVSNSSTVKVKFTTQNGTAVSPQDYERTSGTLTFPPGTLTRKISVPIEDDKLNEADETFFVNLSDPVGAPIGDGQGLGTIKDDDPLPSVSVNNVSVAEGNAGTRAAVFTLTLSAKSGRNVTVDFATFDDTAVAPGDYQPIPAGQVVIPAGSQTGTFSVMVAGDTLLETNEKFFVNLTGATHANLDDDRGVGTIVEDDRALFISDTFVPEGNEGTNDAMFVVTLSVPSSGTVKVKFATENGTALAPGDYTQKTGTLTFSPGDRTRTITVPVKGDRLNEGDETFFVNLSDPTGAPLGDGRGDGTILDDDGPRPNMSISDVTVTEPSSGTVNAVFTVTLAATSTKTVAVTFRTEEDTAHTGSDFIPQSGVLVFNPGETSKTIAVPVKADTRDEPNERFFVRLSNAFNAKLVKEQGVGTIIDAN